MEQKILNRIEELTNKINELAQKREQLIKELRSIDLNIDIMSNIAYELKELLEAKDLPKEPK